MKRHTHQSLAWILTGLLSFGFAQWGCTPKVTYPVQNDIPQESQENNVEQNEIIAMTPPVFVSEELQNQEEQEVAPFIETYSIDAHVSGTIVQVVTEMTIHNPNKRPFSGTLEFPLPEGAILNGYAIDINSGDIKHQMVDAAVVDKVIASDAFESEVKKGIDPGLLLAKRGNTFQTLIYPIPEDGDRRIRMTYTMPLTVNTKGATALSLPMIKSELKERKIHIAVDISGLGKPILSGLGDMQFENAQSVWVLDKIDQNITPQEDLLISMPVLPDIITATESDSKYPDEKYFMIDLKTANHNDAAKPKDLSNLRLIWDASWSRKPDDIKLAREVLAQIPQNGNFELHVLRNILEPSRVFHTRDELLNYIDKLQYDGGTNYTALIELAKTPFAGNTLFFTDGIDTYIGDVPEFGTNSAAVISGEMYDINTMRQVCGGQAFNLKNLTPDEVYQSILTPQTRVAAVEGKNISEVQGIGNLAIGRTTIVGKWNGNPDTVKVILSDGREFSVNINADNIKNARLLATSWASAKVHALAPFPHQNREALLELGKKYNVVSPITSMIVFENYRQWSYYDIEPPESLEEFRNTWLEEKKERMMHKQEQSKDWNEYLTKSWNDRVKWWNQPKPQNVYHEYICPKKNMKACKMTVKSELGSHYTVDFKPPKGWKCNESNHCSTIERSEPRVMFSMRNPDVAGRVRGNGKYVGNSEEFEVVEASIELKDWDPNTPYLKVLKELRSKGADDEALYAEYLRQRQEYEMSTAFYFDVSNYFYQENMQKYATRILSNLTEFKLDNTDLLRVLAWRLRDMKDLDGAILIARKNIKLKPSHNHLWHELALLLEMRARQNMNAVDAHEALECYKKAAFELYENWYARSERAVALVSIEEFNALASWIERQNWPNKKPVIPAIDQNFKKLLDTDLRIIMSWDSDNTDIDLHITEPTTEKIYYRHTRSVEGGLLSADITRGFGPEEYLMKEAPKGEYNISTNYYASHEQNLIGAVTITTTVFKNWGRPNQSQQSIVYRLENPDHNRSDTNDDCDDDDDNCSEDSTIRIGTITVE